MSMQHLFPTKSRDWNAEKLHQHATVSDSLDRILLTEKSILVSNLHRTDTLNRELETVISNQPSA